MLPTGQAQHMQHTHYMSNRTTASNAVAYQVLQFTSLTSSRHLSRSSFPPCFYYCTYIIVVYYCNILLYYCIVVYYCIIVVYYCIIVRSSILF